MDAALHAKRRRSELSARVSRSSILSFFDPLELILVPSFNDMPVRAVLLDIEGTTTPVVFVYEVLFPYARERVSTFLTQNWDDSGVRADIAGLRAEYAADERKDLEPPIWWSGTPEAEQKCAAAYVRWLTDRDRKSAPLKSLQGKIWEWGYRCGELRGEIYSDVGAAFARWRSQKKDICIFSSGSVLAQKLLFAHSTAGDLTPFLRAYFDTTTGPKQEPASYTRIAAAMNLAATSVLFISDVVGELEAAKRAGMLTALCLRPGAKEPVAMEFSVVRTFEEVFP